MQYCDKLSCWSISLNIACTPVLSSCNCLCKLLFTYFALSHKLSLDTAENAKRIFIGSYTTTARGRMLCIRFVGCRNVFQLH